MSNSKKNSGKLRVTLKAYDPKMLDVSSKQITESVISTGSRVSGPIPLPTRTKKVSVIRGPHVDKRGKEIFEQKTHKRVLDILNPTPQTVDVLSNKLNIASGVEVSVSVK